MFTIAFVLVFVALLIEFLRQRWNRFRIFKRMGIPGPKPNFLWGHYKELREDHTLWQERWSAEYGQTYGVFWGDKPFLITSDLDIAKQVMIAQFSNFTDRSQQFALESAHPVAQQMITLKKGQEWKRNRMLLTPAFTTGRMKNMVSLIEKCADDLEENLRRNASGEQFDVYPLLKRFSMDNISRIIFGIETNVQKDSGSNSKLLKSALRFVDTNLTGVMDLICNSYSAINDFFSSVFYWLLSARIIPSGVNDMVDEINKIVRARRAAPPRNDLMQSLLDRQQISSDDSSLTAKDSADDQKSVSSKTTYAKLTDEEVTAAAIVMFMAGYETTSTATAFILNCLGLHRNIQERVRQEIKAATEDRPLSYEIAMNLPYLDAVIREALRLHPPVTNFVTRVAVHDTEINGIEIPAGLNILFPSRQIHMDPKLWENPTVFNPDRFLEKNYNPLAYQAFGDGPRNCVGMRFAYLTMKVLLCRVLQRFEIVATEPPKTRTVSVVSQPVRLNISVKEISS